jgi:hypothetical protein
MSDVIRRIKTLNDFVQGTPIVFVTKLGNVHKVPPASGGWKNQSISEPAVSGRYTGRFDDLAYYGNA